MLSDITKKMSEKFGKAKLLYKKLKFKAIKILFKNSKYINSISNEFKDLIK